MYISYREALDGVVSESDAEALIGLIEHTKNWGTLRGTVPSDVVVSLIDEIKKLKEQQLTYYKTQPSK
ncbi:MAG: hypothetical protein AB7Q37_18505 [Pyrinomonadaceae bacterium]